MTFWSHKLSGQNCQGILPGSFCYGFLFLKVLDQPDVVFFFIPKLTILTLDSH
jgi:hypothetical protein